MNNTFFVRTTTLGLVQEAYWSDPVSLAIPYKTTMAELFDDSNRGIFEETFSRALLEREKVFCSHIAVIEQELELCFFILSLDQNVWVLALDYLPSLPPEILERHKSLLMRMIEQVAIMHARNALHNSQVVYSHFEEIQRLNNQLVNTQRELQRTNRKLERLNTELNNRLVKDPLTSLISRYQYRSEMQAVIEAKPDALGLFAFIDIAAFKQVNDTYGHGVGDEYLVAFAQRLKALTVGYPMVAMRIAGDEFGLYLHDLPHVDDRFFAYLYAQFEARVITDPIETSCGMLPISCSLGFSVYNRDTKDLYDLIDYADWAMYCAKKSGKHGWRSFDPVGFAQRHKNT